MSDNKYIADKLDKLDERLDSIDITLAKQNVSLEHHIKRTEINEKALVVLSDEANARLSKLESSKDMILGGITLLSVIGAVVLWFNELGFSPFK